MNFLKALKYAVVTAIVIAGIIFAAIHFWPTPKQVTLPTGQVIPLDTKAIKQKVDQLNNQIRQLGQQITELQSGIVQKQTSMGVAIAVAGKEMDISKSFAEMVEAWKR